MLHAGFSNQYFAVLTWHSRCWSIQKRPWQRPWILFESRTPTSCQRPVDTSRQYRLPIGDWFSAKKFFLKPVVSRAKITACMGLDEHSAEQRSADISESFRRNFGFRLQSPRNTEPWTGLNSDHNFNCMDLYLCRSHRSIRIHYWLFGGWLPYRSYRW